MATFCYSFGDRLLEWKCPMGKAPKALLACCVLFERDFRAELPSVPKDPWKQCADAWVNHQSMALGVHPLDRKAWMDDAKARGVPTYFNEDGNPEFRRSGDKKKYRKAYKIHDKLAYY